MKRYSKPIRLTLGQEYKELAEVMNNEDLFHIFHLVQQKLVTAKDLIMHEVEVL